MARQPVLVSLEGVVWQGYGLTNNTYWSLDRHSLLRGADRNKGLGKKVALDAIARAVKGRSVNQIKPIVSEAAETVIAKVDEGIAARLKRLFVRNHQLIAMSSAPDFAVEAILARLIGKGLNFSHDYFLASRYETKEGYFTGEHQQLDKHESVERLIGSLGISKFATAFINGGTDTGWALRYCQGIDPVRPGPVLQGALETNRELANKVR